MCSCQTFVFWVCPADFTMVDAPPISSQDAGVDYDDGDAREASETV